MADSQANDNTTCVVCFKNVLYFSIGECDHPVCFECSTRMRVLCLQNECPICRQDLNRVVFTDTIQPYKELRNRVFTDRLFERQFKIGFCTQEIKNAYDLLLENRCKLCDNIPPFRTFTMLSDHIRKVHERYFCDLCVKHLKIFTGERRCYTRQELAHHRRKGDLDDTSHRGHPLCEFCEERFMDADELYRHLRKEHLYCHLCDADGRNLYYASHSALAQHFRTDHYLCEEGECAGQHLTAVFRSEIDLKAHKATVHGRGMNRGAARQARTLELQFNITPHPVAQRTPRDRDRERERVEAPSPPPAAPAPNIDTRSDEQFPRLSATPAGPQLMLAAPSRAYKGSAGLARTDKNFPALDGSGSGSGSGPPRPTPAPPRGHAPQTVAATLKSNSKPSVSIQLHSQPASASNFRLTQTSGNRISIPATPRRPLSDDDFPSLGIARDDHPSIGAGSVQPPKVSFTVSASNFRLTQTSGNHISIPATPRRPLSNDDFPSLGIARDDHPSIGAGSVQPPKVASINSQEMSALSRSQNSHSLSQPKKAPMSSEAFPALSSTSAPATPPQWITVPKSKEKAKPQKQEPPPKPKSLSINAVADFPTLPANTKQKPKKTPPPQPQPAPTPAQNENTKPSKKDKKKNNAKKENIANIADVPYVNGVIDKKIAKELSYGASVNNNQTLESKKIKTAEASSVEKNSNGGNGDFKMAPKDYPPLNPKSENTASSAPRKKMANGTVPPGFKPRPACDGMTFTNSSGQTFSAPVHTYIPPPDFEQRNRDLVKKFAVALGGSAAVEDFKVASRAFRDSIISADEFYQHCRDAVGSQFDTLFPEMVALLPDIAKQQELVVGRNPQLEVCSTCGQLLAPSDEVTHESAHWPPLAPR